MTTQHTPGPWNFSQESIDPEWFIVTAKYGVIVANVNANKTQEANVRLIAAAPELLEVAEAFKQMGERITDENFHFDREDMLTAIRFYLSTIRAAISKAKGQ